MEIAAFFSGETAAFASGPEPASICFGADWLERFVEGAGARRTGWHRGWSRSWRHSSGLENLVYLIIIQLTSHLENVKSDIPSRQPSFQIPSSLQP
jgi:hypothetical protein